MVTRVTTTHPDIPALKTSLQPFLLAQTRDQTLRQMRSLCSKGTFSVLSLTSKDALNQVQAHLVLLNSPHSPFRLNSTFSSARLPARPHLQGHLNLPLAEVLPRWPRAPPRPPHRPTLPSWQCLHLQPRQMLLERKKHFCTHSPAYLVKNQGFVEITYFLKKPEALALSYMFSTPHTYAGSCWAWGSLTTVETAALPQTIYPKCSWLWDHSPHLPLFSSNQHVTQYL